MMKLLLLLLSIIFALTISAEETIKVIICDEVEKTFAKGTDALKGFTSVTTSQYSGITELYCLGMKKPAHLILPKSIIVGHFL